MQLTEAQDPMAAPASPPLETARAERVEFCRTCTHFTFGSGGHTGDCAQGHGYNISKEWGCEDWEYSARQSSRVPPAPAPTEAQTKEAKRAALEESLRLADEAETTVYRLRYELKAQLAELDGDAFHAKWDRAIANGDHAEADRCYREDQARNFIERGSFYGDPSEKVKAEIMAVVERIRSQS